MSRKTRTWRCPCCRASWHRRKNDGHWPLDGSTCRRCDVPLVRGRTVTARIRCRHLRASERVRQFEQRLGAKPRTRSQRVLSPSPEVRRLWSEVRRAKTRPAIIRRSQRFLDALLEQTRDGVGPDGQTRWTKKMRIRDGRVEVRRHSGGRTGVPEIRDDSAKMGESLLGQYRSSLLEGSYEVRLNSRVLSPTELRATVVHEILHVLDAEASVDHDFHGRLWKRRLGRMFDLFPPTPFGVRMTDHDRKEFIG